MVPAWGIEFGPRVDQSWLVELQSLFRAVSSSLPPVHLDIAFIILTFEAGDAGTAAAKVGTRCPAMGQNR